MNYRIVAIGNTDTAKSTCLATAYRVMREGIQDKKVLRNNCIYVGQNNDLEYLCSSTAMTSANQGYDLQLCINRKTLFTISWYDTVGDSINPNNGWHPDTVEHIRGAHYVFAFFSCDELVKSDLQTLRRTVKKIEMTLNTAMEGGSSFKLVICLSKSDTVSREQLDEIRSIFANVRSSVTGIRTMLYFVSTMQGHNFNSPMAPLLMAVDECLEKYEDSLSALSIGGKLRVSATNHAIDRWKGRYSSGAWL